MNFTEFHLTRKRNPYTEGSVAEFYRLFLKPLRAFKPENLSAPYWDDVILATEGREIWQFEVLEGFSIPGHLMNMPRIIGSGLPEYRFAVTGQRLFMRREEGEDHVDIENPVDADCYDRVFRSDASSLQALTGKLRRITDE